MSEQPADIRESWNANAAAWTELSRSGADRHRDLVNTPAFFRELPPVAGLRCLDVGCGEGHNTRLLAGQRAQVVAIDLAEAFLTAAAGLNSDGISYLHADGGRLPFRDATFDAVTAFMTLQDVTDPELPDDLRLARRRSRRRTDDRCRRRAARGRGDGAGPPGRGR